MTPYRESLRNDGIGPHSASEDWTYTMPKPPIITTQAIPTDSRGLTQLPLEYGQSYDPNLSGLRGVDFIKHIDYDGCMAKTSISDWSYESRRTAQQILPFLYLGPTNVTRDLSLLREKGVTMIVSFRYAAMAHIKGPASKAAGAIGIELKEIMAPTRSDIIPMFSEVMTAINAHMTQRFSYSKVGLTSEISSVDELPGRVLVVCETGSGESALFTAAYIMAVHCKGWEYAAQIVQSQRFCTIFGNAEFQLLRTFDDLLRAQRDVVQAGVRTGSASILPQQSFTNVHTHKRVLEIDDMQQCGESDKFDNMDQSRFDDRAMTEPFYDTP